LPYDASSFQTSTGSLWLPNQPIDDVSTAYLNTLIAHDKFLDADSPANVTLADFKTNKCVYSQTLERSLILQGTGLPVNQGRNAILHINFNALPAQTEANYAAGLLPLPLAEPTADDTYVPALTITRKITVFIRHLRVAKKFANVIRVSE